MRVLVTCLLIATALGSLSACDSRVWKGPLAMAADSIFRARPVEGCDSAGVDHFEGAEVPVASCRSIRGDTTLIVVSDRDGRALIVSRVIAVDSVRQAAVHDSLQFEVSNDYQAPIICPQVGDSVESGVRLWNTLDRQIVVKNQGVDRVILELRTDHPACRGG